MKLLGAAALAAVTVLATRTASAQNNLLASWTFSNSIPNYGFVPGTTNSIPQAPTYANPNLIIGALKQGPGVVPSPVTNSYFGGQGWTNAGVADSEANSIANGLYVTYTVQAAPGFKVSFSTNSMYVYRASGGPSFGMLQYSPDGITYTNISTNAYTTGTYVTNKLATNGLANIPSTVTNFFRLVIWGATSPTAIWSIENGAPAFQMLGTVADSAGGVAPSSAVVTPASTTVNAGSTLVLTASAVGDPTSNFWYRVSGGVTNLVAFTTNTYSAAAYTALSIPNVTGANAGMYFCVLTNVSGSVTSTLASVSVNDPIISVQPNNTYGALDGVATFTALAAGSPTINYQWWYADTTGTQIAPVSNGLQTDGLTYIYGATASTLTVSNLQTSDPTNFVLVATGPSGSATSQPASLLGVSGTGVILAFWNFDQTNFLSMVTNPVAWFGNGTASFSSAYCGAQSGSADADDGPGAPFPGGLGANGGRTNYSWAIYNLAAAYTNQNKIFYQQYNFSTAGAKNITLSLEARATGTASDYFRLQYTTNGGTSWIDYPTSSTFSSAASTYLSFSYDLTGFPNVANNPNFGVRLTDEFANSATYGNNITNAYVGIGNTFGLGGTFTLDLVDFMGTGITNNNQPPVITLNSYSISGGTAIPITGGLTNISALDTNSITINYTVTDDSTPANQLSTALVGLVPSTFYVGASYGNPTSGTLTGTGSFTIAPSSIGSTFAGQPVQFTVTDTNGDSATTWFTLSLSSFNQPPTNSLASLKLTNTLANTVLSIPFVMTDDHTPTNGYSFTYSTGGNNGGLISSIVVNASGTGNSNAVLVITPASNQVGVASVSVTAYDNDPNEPKSTTVSFPVVVQPNTNVVAVDFFDYDGGSATLDAEGYWSHLSGNGGSKGLQAGGGVAVVNTFDTSSTENIQIPLLGAPYNTNSGVTLYASFNVNLAANPLYYPKGEGSYFALFNDGSGLTDKNQDRVMATTNGAPYGYYKLGINNFGSDDTTGILFPQNLTPGSNYNVVVSICLSNGFATLWVNPASQASPSVTDTTAISTITNLFNIKDFELRQSGSATGVIDLGYLKVGTSFDSVFPAPHVTTVGANTVVNWSDPSLVLTSTTNLTIPFTPVNGNSPYTNAFSPGGAVFYQLQP